MNSVASTQNRKKKSYFHLINSYAYCFDRLALKVSKTRGLIQINVHAITVYKSRLTTNEPIVAYCFKHQYSLGNFPPLW